MTTPVEITHQTTGSSVTSSSSRGVGFYFLCAVTVIGVVGAALNALVLYGLVASKQHKNHVLIFNQNLLDFVSCFSLAATYAAKLCKIHLNGTRRYWLCLAVVGEASIWGPVMGSMINLASITIERYLRVVHHVWAKKKLRNCTIYSAAAFAWVSGAVVAAAVNITTTNVVNGVCLSENIWKSHAARKAFGIWYILSFYVIILLIFIFCYWRILITIRRQAAVMAAHNEAGPSTDQTQLRQIQINVVKTMLLVSVLFTITWTPAHVCTFLSYVAQVRPSNSTVDAVLFIGYFYVCINPFIYATKFDPVRRVLIRLIPCNKSTQPLENIQMT